MTISNEFFRKLMAPGRMATLLEGDKFSKYEEAAKKAYIQERLSAVSKMHKDRNDRLRALRGRK